MNTLEDAVLWLEGLPKERVVNIYRSISPSNSVSLWQVEILSGAEDRDVISRGDEDTLLEAIRMTQERYDSNYYHWRD